MNVRGWIRLTVAAALLAGAGAAVAQDAAADQAKALLDQGVKHYKAMDFAGAQKALLAADADALGDADKATLNSYLVKVGTAVTEQKEGRGAYRRGQDALDASQLETARDLFARAEANTYLTEPERKDARAKLAEVTEKIRVLEAAKPPVTVEPVPDPPPDAGETPPAKPTPDPTPAPPVETEAERSLRQYAERRRADRARAEELTRQGRAALRAKKFNEAQRLFQQAFELAETGEAKKGLKDVEEARKLVAPNRMLSDYETRRRVEKEATLVDFDQAMRASAEALTSAKSDADFRNAHQHASVASHTIELNKSLFSRDEYANYKRQADEQIKYVEIRRQAAATDRVLEQERELRIKDAKRIGRMNQDQKERIAGLVRRARTLRSETKYGEAMNEVEQILRLDSSHALAQEWKVWLQQYLLLQQERIHRRQARIEEQKQYIEMAERFIPWYEVLRYPQNWREIREQRRKFSAASAYTSEEDERVRDALQRTHRTLDFSGVPISGVFESLSDEGKIPIHVNWPALQHAGVEPTRKVHLKLANADITLDKALDTVLSDVASGLGSGRGGELKYIVDRGVVTVSTTADLARHTSVQVYGIRDLIMPLRDAPTASRNADGRKWRVNGRRTRGRGPNGQYEDQRRGGIDYDEADDWADGKDAGDETTPETMMANIIKTIQESIDPTSWREAGGEYASISTHNGQLIVAQTEENHEAIEGLLNKLRETSSLQVAVEARFLTVSTGFINDIGIDLDFYFNIGSGLGSHFVTDPYTGAQVPAVGSSGWGAGKPGGWAKPNTTPIAIAPQTLGFASMIGVNTGVPQGVGGTVTNPGLSISGVFLDDIQVNFMINATKAHSATRVLNAPRLTLFNGTQASISFDTSQSYVYTLEPVTDAGDTGAVIGYRPDIRTESTGTSLEVRATVSADRKYVTLGLTLDTRVLNGFTTYTFPTTSGTGDDTVVIEQTIQLPNVTSQNVSTTVSVPDRGTLLLGGLSLAGEVEREWVCRS